MKTVGRYLWELLLTVRQIWGIANLFILILGIAGLVLSKQFSMYFILASFYVAGFLAWKQAVDRLPKGVTVVVERHHLGTRAYLGNGRVESPLALTIDLDIINHDQDELHLRELKITKFKLDSNLFGEQPRGTILGSSAYPEYLPIIIEGKRRRTLKYTLEVELMERDLEMLAERMSHFAGGYEVEIQYDFEDLTRRKHPGTISVKGSFEDFRRGVVKHWESIKRHDLVSSVKGPL